MLGLGLQVINNESGNLIELDEILSLAITGNLYNICNYLHLADVS